MEYLFKKPPVPTKRATVILIKVKSWNALSSMLLVCISVYIKSVLRYTFLISMPAIGTLYWHEQGHSVLNFWGQKRVLERKSLGNTGMDACLIVGSFINVTTSTCARRLLFCYCSVYWCLIQHRYGHILYSSYFSKESWLLNVNR
jgi:hypothetical protein